MVVLKWIGALVAALLSAGFYAAYGLIANDVHYNAHNHPNVLELTNERIDYLVSLPDWLTYWSYGIAALGLLGALLLLFRLSVSSLVLMLSALLLFARWAVEIGLYEWAAYGDEVFRIDDFFALEAGAGVLAILLVLASRLVARRG